MHTYTIVLQFYNTPVHTEQVPYMWQQPYGQYYGDSDIYVVMTLH